MLFKFMGTPWPRGEKCRRGHREKGPKSSQPKDEGPGYSHSRRNQWRDIQKISPPSVPWGRRTVKLKLITQTAQQTARLRFGAEDRRLNT